MGKHYAEFRPPVAVERPWLGDAACRDSNPDLFFLPVGQSAMPAYRICASCRVWEACLDWATWGMFQECGIWGGTTCAHRLELRAARLSIGQVRGQLDETLATQEVNA